MSDLTASGHFAGGASADLHSLIRVIGLGGNRSRRAQLRHRQRAVPEDWFERLTDQSDRFAAVGNSADIRAIPKPFKDMPDAESTVPLPDVPEFELLQPVFPEATVAPERHKLRWGCSFASITLHGVFAAVLMSIGFQVELPQVEGETAVAVNIIGNAAFDELASGDDADGPAVEEPTPLVPVAGPVNPEMDFKVAPVEKPDVVPLPPLRAPVEPALPPLALMTTTQPARTAVLTQPELPKPVEAKAPVVERQPEPVKKLEPEIKSKAQPVKKPEPVAKVKPKPEKLKEVRAQKPTVAKQKVVAKVSSKEPAAKTETSKVKSAKAAGKAGSGKADSRKGAADGAEKGQATSKSAGKSAGKTGNATASNYPGLVQRKIARTRKKSGSGKGNVVISFSITTSGGLGSVSVARSSGTSSVDAAALDHVRRSAPFPAPPAGAQTRFQIPVTIR